MVINYSLGLHTIYLLYFPHTGTLSGQYRYSESINSLLMNLRYGWKLVHMAQGLDKNHAMTVLEEKYPKQKLLPNPRTYDFVYLKLDTQNGTVITDRPWVCLAVLKQRRDPTKAITVIPTYKPIKSVTF